MPITIDNWYKATNRPLIFGGENSEMYMGAKTEAMPTPNPPRRRAAIRIVNVGGIVEPRAETKNNQAAKTKIGLRPNRSLKAPATNAPKIAPTRAELPNHPTCNLPRANCTSTSLKVPEITAVSKPNSIPPREATKHTRKRKKLLFFPDTTSEFISELFSIEFVKVFYMFYRFKNISHR